MTVSILYLRPDDHADLHALPAWPSGDGKKQNKRHAEMAMIKCFNSTADSSIFVTRIRIHVHLDERCFGLSVYGS